MIDPDIAFVKLSQLIPLFESIFLSMFIGVQFSVWIFGKFIFSEQSIEHINFKAVFKGAKIFTYIILISFLGLIIADILISSQKNMSVPMINALIKTKWALFVFLGLNLGYMIYKSNKAKEAYKQKELLFCRENIIIITRYFMPLNLIITIGSMYLGISIKEF